MTHSPLSILESIAQRRSSSSAISSQPIRTNDIDAHAVQACHPLDFLRSRLSRRIVLSVFSSIVAIEALILIPSVYKYERDLLTHLSQQSSASLSTTFPPPSEAQTLTPQQLLQQITPLQALPWITGGSLYRKAGPNAGEYLGSFGEPPQLTYFSRQNAHFNRREHHYDSIWTSPLIKDYQIIIRHDAQAIRGQVLAYIGRIMGLVLLISGVVTLSTMIVLRSLLITPILALRRDLLRAAPAALRARGSVPTTFDSLQYRRHDELGEVIKAFEQMFDQITISINERQKVAAAQARLAEIGELAAMIVHEVRNPLATIYMALTGFGKLKLPRAGQLRLELAMEEAERLKRLLNEILTYSREQRLAGEGVEINDLCQALYQSLHQLPTVQERKIQLKPCSHKLIVNGDRDKLKQVFINLVTNACEAIPVGDTVHWTLEHLSQVSQNSTVQQVKIQIQNGGDPIPPDVLPKLTQPFVSTKDGGNGLGLAITKRIIEAHGGSLSITSNAEQGTIATVLLPVADEQYKILRGIQD